MNPKEFGEWLASLPMPARVRALALIYSRLTVQTRELFLPEWTARKDLSVIDMLHGINEIHHTLSNALGAYVSGNGYPHSLDGLGRMLVDNATKYHVEFFLESAVEYAMGGVPPLGS